MEKVCTDKTQSHLLLCLKARRWYNGKQIAEDFKT